MEPSAEQPKIDIQKSIRRRTIATWIIFGISAALAIYVYIQTKPPPPHKYDDLAQCIANTSTTFYGAFWCPHCADQKTKFGTGAQFLPYHECSTPDANGELTSCVNAGVQHYPTWVFPDGTRLTGVQSIETLAKKPGCPLPTSTQP